MAEILIIFSSPINFVTLSFNGKPDNSAIIELITSSVYSPVSLVYPMFLSTLSNSSVGTSVNKTYSSSVVPKCLVLLPVCNQPVDQALSYHHFLV